VRPRRRLAYDEAMRKLRWVLICAALLSGGCDQQKLVRLVVSQADEQAARSYLDELKHRDFAALEPVLDPSMKTDNLREALSAMAAQFPDGEPLSSKIVGAQTNKTADSSSSDITFEFQYPKSWLLASVAVKRSGGVTTILGMRVKQLADSLEHINRFNLDGKPLLDYAALALAVLIPFFTLCALAVALRTPVRRRWLWIVFILFGVGRFAVNWTTGELGVQPFTAQLFGASVSNPGYGPWTIGLSVPLGAILFLLRRRALAASAPATTP
jgi:hypothetical protein